MIIQQKRQMRANREGREYRPPFTSYKSDGFGIDKLYSGEIERVLASCPSAFAGEYETFSIKGKLYVLNQRYQEVLHNFYSALVKITNANRSRTESVRACISRLPAKRIRSSEFSSTVKIRYIKMRHRR